MAMQFSLRWTFWGCLLCLGLGAFSSVLLQACDQRACRAYQTKTDAGQSLLVVNSTPCRGYACDSKTLLCRFSCKDDTECDDGVLPPGTPGVSVTPGDNTNTNKPRAFVCRSGKCVCNDANTPEAKALFCHDWCESNDDCNSRTNPKTGESLSVARGYTCKKVDGRSTRACVCNDPTRGCKLPVEPTQELPPEVAEEESTAGDVEAETEEQGTPEKEAPSGDAG